MGRKRMSTILVLGPRGAAERVRNRWAEEARDRGYEWAQRYASGITKANLKGFDNLAIWYEILDMRRASIAQVFDELKREYLSRLGAMPLAPARREILVPAR